MSSTLTAAACAAEILSSAPAQHLERLHALIAVPAAHRLHEEDRRATHAFLEDAHYIEPGADAGPLLDALRDALRKGGA